MNIANLMELKPKIHNMEHWFEEMRLKVANLEECKLKVVSPP